MKKLFKILPVIIVIIVCSFVMVNVFADNKPEVKEYIQRNYYSAVLYSNNDLYVWGNSNNYGTHYLNTIIENVTDIINYDGYTIGLIDTDNNFKIVYTDERYDYEKKEYIGAYQVTDAIKTNVKKIDNLHLLTKDNKLYKYNYNCDSCEEEYSETLIMENVKDWEYDSSNNGSYLILDNNNNLYAYGYNIYGKKINDGENITEAPIKIAENVKEFSFANDNYYNITPHYITNNNELYTISYELPYPKLLKKNVSKYLFGRFYISEGKTYKISYEIEDDEINVYKDELIINDELVSIGYNYVPGEYSDNYYLTKKGDLYDPRYNKVYSNIKQLYHVYNGAYYIVKEDETMSSIKYEASYDINENREYYTKENKQLINVKEIIAEGTLIMSDDTIYVRGISSYYDKADFNGTSPKDYNNFVVIKGLPNVKENITLSQITLHHNNKTHFAEGTTADYYVDVFPYNATNKEIEWISSDEKIATVSQKGTIKLLKAGTATIKVKAKNVDVYDEVKITVHPKNTGIEILGEDEITINKYEDYMLTVKVTPEGVFDQKLKWTSNAGKNKYDEDIIYFFGINEEFNRCYEDEDGVCPDEYNEIGFDVREIGTYTITVTTEDGLYSDSIKVNVIQEIESLSPGITEENALGSTLYIYMKESKTMDLKMKIYPEDATDKELVYTSSDETIATVDEKGVVTAKKAGKVKITIKAKNYDVKREFNVLIFDETIDTKLGDVNGDGFVDILDVVKLRRHVAKVEALE